MTLDGLHRIKGILKEDKEEAHTYWGLLLLNLLCGRVFDKQIEKEESVAEAMTHMQVEDMFVSLIKKHVESSPEFHIMVHQAFGHMIMADSILRKYYVKNELHLSLVPLIDNPVIELAHTALSVLAIVVSSVSVIFILIRTTRTRKTATSSKPR